MNALVKKLVSGAVLWLAKEYKRSSVGLLKLKAATSYLQSIQSARSGLMFACLGFLALQLAIAGAILVPMGIVQYWPQDDMGKMYFLAGTGILYLVIAFIVVRIACSDKVWMNLPGVDWAVKEAEKER